MLCEGMAAVTPSLENITKDLTKKIKLWKTVPMLSRTHGQPATPTTMGHELCVFLVRAERIMEATQSIQRKIGQH